MPNNFNTNDFDSFNNNNEQTYDLSAIADKQVLVVEDNPINQEVIQSVLLHIGVQPVIVDSGKGALALIIDQKHYFPIILMDCEMPILNGFNTSIKIRDYEAITKIKPAIIVSLSAYYGDEHEQQCNAAGMNYLLTKPLVIKEMKELLFKLQAML